MPYERGKKNNLLILLLHILNCIACQLLQQSIVKHHRESFCLMISCAHTHDLTEKLFIAFIGESAKGVFLDCVWHVCTRGGVACRALR